MSDWKQIAIELYRDGMARRLIAEKLELSRRQLDGYLKGQPLPERAKTKGLRISKAKQEGLRLLAQGMSVQEVHERLNGRGMKIALPTVKEWRQAAQGPVNKRVNTAVVSEILAAEAGIRLADVCALYRNRTGEAPSKQAIGYWTRKLRAAA